MTLGVNDFNLQSNKNTYAGSDIGDPVYVVFLPLKRIVTFKAFIDSIKINTTKENEEINNADKQDIVILEHVGAYNIDVTLNLPAGNVEESYNNVAKIEELQRLTAPLNKVKKGGKYENLSNEIGIDQPVFKVWYRNLISNGRPWGNSYPRQAQFSLIDKCGFPCFIDNISYEPEVESGFFKHDGMLFPKNIKLSLKLKYDAQTDRNRPDIAGTVIEGFKTNGSFGEFDFGLAPFGVRVCDGFDRQDEQPNIRLSIPKDSLREYSSQNLNDLADLNNDSYLFVSLPITGRNQEGGFPRFVFLKGFLNNHSRDFSTDITYANTKATGVGNVTDKTAITFKNLKYVFSLTMPASNKDEAKRNCGKIQYLLRMYYKATIGYGLKSELKTNQSNELINNQNLKRSEDEQQFDANNLVSNSFKKVAVFYPSILERPGVSDSSPIIYPAVIEAYPMIEKSVFLHFLSFNFEIDKDAGYFIDADGRFYPKAMTLNFEFIDSSGEKIKNYELDNDDGEYTHRVSKEVGFKYNEHLFPFNRKTVKIGSNVPMDID